MILTDTPGWPWRGKLWGHLVSDSSLEELHEFAQRIGKRRIGFQGDHYDIDAEEHALAVREGAQCVDSRELVRRLRDSGLRKRSKKETWSIAYQSENVHPYVKVNEIAAGVITRRDHRDSAQRALASARSSSDPISVLIVERSKETAIVLEVLDPPLFDPRTVDYLIHTMKGDVTTVELIFDSSERSSH